MAGLIQPVREQRSVRVEDELWYPAMARAAREDDTLSQVIRRFLDGYVKSDPLHQDTKSEEDFAVAARPLGQ